MNGLADPQPRQAPGQHVHWSLTCFQLQMYTGGRQPCGHWNQHGLDQRGVLPDVRQQLVKAVNVQGLHHQRGDVDGFPAGDVVGQRDVVGAAGVLLHLRWREGRERLRSAALLLELPRILVLQPPGCTHVVFILFSLKKILAVFSFFSRMCLRHCFLFTSSILKINACVSSIN